MMDLQSKQRLTGAIIWLLGLVIIVPYWYSNPVNFMPEGEQQTASKSSMPVIEHAYRLPSVKSSTTEKQPVTDKQLSQQTPTIAEQAVAADKVLMTEVIEDDFIDRFSNRQAYAGQWIVRLQAFNNIGQANELARKIRSEYPVYIKYFEKTQVFSVRTGPYISQLKAEKAKQKLDKILRTDGKVRQLPKNS